jgi:hypothetical protein
VLSALLLGAVACSNQAEQGALPDSPHGALPASTAFTTANLGLWLAADVGISATGTADVYGWADQSSEHNDASMPLSSWPRQPKLFTNQINGRPAVYFRGAASLVLTRPISASTFTIYIVGENSQSSESFSMILGPAGSVGNNQLRWQGGSQLLFVGASGSASASIGNDRVFHTLTLRYDGSSFTIARDGKTVAVSPASFQLGSPWVFNQLGAWYSSYFMVGSIAEVLVYTAALSPADGQDVMSYLGGKYGLPTGIVSCGALGQQCCGSTCPTSGVCGDGSCVDSCGNLGDQCCDSSYCNGAYNCDFGSCDVCGYYGQPCCNGFDCFGGTCSSGFCN